MSWETSVRRVLGISVYLWRKHLTMEYTLYTQYYDVRRFSSFTQFVNFHGINNVNFFSHTVDIIQLMVHSIVNCSLTHVTRPHVVIYCFFPSLSCMETNRMVTVILEQMMYQTQNIIIHRQCIFYYRHGMPTAEVYPFSRIFMCLS